jgi:hypothetical protein
VQFHVGGSALRSLILEVEFCSGFTQLFPYFVEGRSALFLFLNEGHRSQELVEFAPAMAAYWQGRALLSWEM